MVCLVNYWARTVKAGGNLTKGKEKKKFEGLFSFDVFLINNSQ